MKRPIVAIVGRANVGKSSLFNRLVTQRQAIVAEEAGTTRDSISGLVRLQEQEFWVVDTAGLKKPDDEFEFSIQQQIAQASESADLILVVVDGQSVLSEEDRRVAKLALKTKKPVLLAINKSESGKVTPWSFEKLGIAQMFRVSAIHNEGIDQLISAIVELIPHSKPKRDHVQRLALIGRPNVGKSSLFNTLLVKQQATVAAVSGTTRDVNRRQLKWHNQTIELLDTAGIRRPGATGKGVEYFSSLRALDAIQQADVCGLLIDATEPATKLDQKIAGMIKDAERGLIIILNKWDLIEDASAASAQMIQLLQRQLPFVYWAPVVFVSAETGRNASKLLELMQEIISNRAHQVEESELGPWLIKALTHHPPSGLRQTRPHIDSVKQLGVSPPTFGFYGRHLEGLHWSYKRYLEKELRTLADFSGTPLRLEFNSVTPDNSQV